MGLPVPLDKALSVPIIYLLHENMCNGRIQEPAMTTNITLRVKTRLLREAKVLAAREGTSVSGLLADLLEERIRQAKGYDARKKRALLILKQGRKLRWTPPRSRDELHER